MKKKKQKLELTWIGKDERPKLEPRILIEDPDRSYHAKERRSDDDIFDNILIHGDNLLALKALEAEYTGKVKCIYIDPPYNTGSAFAHYDDGVEHSLWLSLFRDRVQLLRELMREDGSLWISLDDNESHYAKVLCDEIFGRSNFVSNVIWQKLYTVKNSAKYISDMHDHILVYAKNKEKWQRNLFPRTEKSAGNYSNLDEDPRGPWTTNAVQARNYYSLGSYEIHSPNGKIFKPPSGTFWRISEQSFEDLDNDNRIWWGKNGDAIPRVKKFLSEAKDGVVPASLWLYKDAGSNAESKQEARQIFEGEDDIFITPKPEKLIKQILTLASDPGDIVLDSFAGSGTTGAVAQKMGRRWIMIELGDHCHTHVAPRLQKVIGGDDLGGITEVVNWKGGGGFRYYHLAPSLLEKDKYGNWVISEKYNPSMLAEALCKNMGFVYEPSQDENEYWQHGHSTETDFIFVTTASMTHAALKKLSEDVGPDRSLLVCCKAFNADADAFENLTIKKIPHAVLSKCEWGHDDYSLNVANLPMAKSDEEIEQEKMAEELPLFGKKEG